MSTKEEYENMSASEKKKEDWMNSKWRPMMGWSYMATCICDFVLFPVLWSVIQTLLKQPLTQWQPITLQGAGLYHIAMGAVLGIAAFGRTQEKLVGANAGGLVPSTAMPAANTTPVTPAASFAPAPVPSVPVATAPVAVMPAESQSVTLGFGGKKAPPPAIDPIL